LSIKAGDISLGNLPLLSHCRSRGIYISRRRLGRFQPVYIILWGLKYIFWLFFCWRNITWSESLGCSLVWNVLISKIVEKIKICLLRYLLKSGHWLPLLILTLQCLSFQIIILAQIFEWSRLCGRNLFLLDFFHRSIVHGVIVPYHSRLMITSANDDMINLILWGRWYIDCFLYTVF